MRKLNTQEIGSVNGGCDELAITAYATALYAPEISVGLGVVGFMACW